MTSTAPPRTETPVTRGARTGGARRRPFVSRLSTGHALLLLAALVAGLANFAVLRSVDDRIEVVVAARDLVPGVAVTAADLSTTRVGLGDAAEAGLLDASDLDGIVGAVPSVAVPAGAVLRPDDVRPAATQAGLRRMSLPIERERAVAGAIGVGDRVDVLATVDGRSAWLLGDLGVLAVGGSDGGALGDVGRSFSLTVGVDAESARCLATALATSELTVVLATGTEPVVADGCTTLVPAGTTDAAADDG